MTHNVPKTEVLQEDVIVLLTDNRLSRLGGSLHVVQQLAVPPNPLRHVIVETFRYKEEYCLYTVVEAM